MNSLGLVFKVFWTPGETMFRISKNPRVLLPVIVITIMSLVVSIIFSAIGVGLQMTWL